jgi:PST family polysaccharide transporter
VTQPGQPVGRADQAPATAGGATADASADADAKATAGGIADVTTGGTAAAAAGGTADVTAGAAAGGTGGVAASSTAGLGRMLARGALWSSLSTTVLRLGQFVLSIIIARLISPHDFGVFVVASTVYLIVINISEVGVSTALVREVDNARRIAPTVSSIAIVNSALLAAVLFLAAPYLAATFGAPGATTAARVLAIPVLLAGPTAVPAALLTRDFRQGRKMAADLTNFVVANGILLVLALNGSGVMALAWSRVAGQVVSAVLLFALAPERYRPGFDRREAARLLRFGAPLAGSSLAVFILSNVDFMVVGRLAGPLQLGYYNLAFTVSSWPTSIFTAILTSVTLPALARVKGGITELGRHVSVALAALCAAAFLVATLGMVLAHPLVTVVYGSRWAPAAPILLVLAVFGAVRVTLALFYDVLVALGHTRWLFRLQLIWLGVLLPAMLLAVHLGGGRGAGFAHVFVAVLVVVPVHLIVLARAVRFPLKKLRGPVAYPLLAAILAGTASFLLADQFVSPWAKLMWGGAAFVVVYFGALGHWLLAIGRELVELYGRKGSRREATDGPAHAATAPTVDLTMAGMAETP